MVRGQYLRTVQTLVRVSGLPEPDCSPEHTVVLSFLRVVLSINQIGTHPILSASATQHEGTIPKTASRMTMSAIFLSFGHGLKGFLPHIPGT
eukprot:2348414-Amphidinium_carterae.1